MTDIEISQIAYKPFDGYYTGTLTLKISGKDVTDEMVNSIRRAAEKCIPIYAYPPELIKITTNNCIAFDNDFMSRTIINNIPIPYCDPELFFLHDKHWRNVNFSDDSRDKHPDEQNIDMYVNATNTSHDIIEIDASDDSIDLRINNERSDKYKMTKDLCIIKLRPNDKFSCHAKAVLGVGEKHAIWSAANGGNYNPETGVFVICSNGQINEYNVLIRACKFLSKKINDLREQLIETYNSLDKRSLYEFLLHNENHTIGNIVNYEFQSHKDTISSAIVKPDHMKNQVIIKIESSNLKKTINESCDKLILLLSTYEKKFTNLRNKYVTEEELNKYKIIREKENTEKEIKSKSKKTRSKSR